MIARVALSGAVYSMDKRYDYLVPERLEANAAVGKRVSVPFARGNRRQEGMVFSLEENSSFPRLKPIDAFLDEEPILDEDCLKLAGSYFTEEEVQEAVDAFCSGGIRSVDGGNIYYDPEARKFFQVLVDGNYYHGYDVDYSVMTKEEVIRWCTRFHFSVDGFTDCCRKKQVPMLVIIKSLPFEEGPYSPPDNFGYGVHFV